MTELNRDALNNALLFARQITRDAAQRLKQQRGKISASFKHDGSFVTQFDIDTDHALTQAIRARYPSHGVLSEEQDKIYKGEEWCWVIDPIDGTTNFTWGFPLWGVLVGLLHHGQPVIGVADFPLVDEHYHAAIGHGAFLNDEPITAMQIDELHPSQLFATCSRAVKRANVKFELKTRIAGTTGYDLAQLACGVVVGAFNLSVHVWDVAALWPLLAESGAQVKTTCADGLFPLKRDVDYAAIEFSVLGGCNAHVLSRLSEKTKDVLPMLS